MDGTLYQKNCFDLQSGCEGPKKSYYFHLHGCAKSYKNKTNNSFFAFQFCQIFYENIFFLSCHFDLHCSFIISSLCYGETREL
jgi:hypothetical protein